MPKASRAKNHLSGMLLVAMPGMADERFARSLVYLCTHTPDGAMGLIVNQRAPSIGFPSIIEQLGIKTSIDLSATPVHVGGPVESSRGFVLHSPDYVRDTTLVIDQAHALTATIDILKAMASGSGPKRALFALGYAGWAAGQLDTEIQRNGWLIREPDADLIYGADDNGKWQRAMRSMGIDPALLSTAAGHA